MRIDMVHDPEELAALVDEVGFLPFFRCGVPGLSVAEHTPEELWFTGEEGPWEWKGPVIGRSGCAYGKFFGGKAGFVSRAWFPDLANYRREGYDLDARYEDGLATNQEKQIWDVLGREHSLLSKELRARSGLDRRHFDAAIGRLQHRCYVTTTDFEYALDAHGRPYGWGVARYALPEAHFGAAFEGHVYARRPEESEARILAQLSRIAPEASEAQLRKLIK